MNPSESAKLKFEFENFEIRQQNKKAIEKFVFTDKTFGCSIDGLFSIFSKQQYCRGVSITLQKYHPPSLASLSTQYTHATMEQQKTPRCRFVIPQNKLTKWERYEICAKSVDPFVRDYIRDQIFFHYRKEKSINIRKFISEVSNDLKKNDIDFLPSKMQFWRILRGMDYQYFLFFVAVQPLI